MITAVSAVHLCVCMCASVMHAGTFILLSSLLNSVASFILQQDKFMETPSE